ncbi:asparagine synthase (glutamine-hydrolyzing) [Aquibacillus sp. 3ASR75-11]|uniref:asparagine synthase (glutamine-hydrolyzing) n=1 Tax=Terrihalobacillus insolitus TaxID=2950438 RepID=A0A9X3WMP8_9BACI|nr:asparagine synthase (glutamine-hydrolyzing) [Terrihalobacillus insolitus]MDC3412415.1 asparagine synthase (glutamine-hydrolyzing) [Terrihalobacillus insolitus]MDC3422892.1 asparagine synthase (glutamine-hydrolyzing) [Terrihalobacillus insolitus]
MCGFVGMIRNRPKTIDQTEEKIFQNKNDVISHRGPDDEGYFHDPYISFGFRRLSIIDIESGHQPLSYNDENYWMVFNGEIYNYVELRKQLMEQGYTFETESDTEVIAAMFQEYKTDAFRQLRGMFAILLWDKKEETLYGARDPFGIKPLFYKETEEGTYFASEKKSLTVMEEKEEVNTEALQHYLSFQFSPEPFTLTAGIYKTEPGHYFVKKPGESLQFHQYWHANFKPVLMDKNAWINRIRDVMYDSVNVHMRSDVPVGSFLSGGIDSSVIVAMAREMNPNLKTFSVGFENEGYSEVDVAKETADKLGVENISYIISPEEYVQKLPKIMWHMDDPLADPACVPLYFVAREARKHVTVVLSGEGADELFGGYNIYREPESLRIFQTIPTPAKGLLSRVASALPEGVRGKSFLERGTTPLKDRYIGNAKMFEDDDKAMLLKSYHPNVTYQQITEKLFKHVEAEHPVNQMQYVDIHTWLRGDILLKADKMTMANSLELRVPFLDKEVFEIASQIPVDLKIANGTTKQILREAARGVVPDHVLDRKKLGFPVPIRHWLKNELYDWAKRLIQESQTDYLLHKNYVSALLEDHCKGKGDFSRKIWTVLMFMLWHQLYVEKKYDIETLREEDKWVSKLTV